MKKIAVKKWDENNHTLDAYFREKVAEGNFINYDCVVGALLDCIFVEKGKIIYNKNKMVEIDHGDYDGCLLFICPEYTYTPSPDEYIMFNTYYGSCSGCDTIQAINDTSNVDRKVKDLINLARDICMSARSPWNWCNNDDWSDM